jgi:hypothetical protein
VVDVARIAYELAVPLDEMPAAVPFQTGADLMDLLSELSGLEQPGDLKRRRVDWRLDETTGRLASIRSISEPDLAQRTVISLVHGFEEVEQASHLPKSWSVRSGKTAARIAGRLGDTPDSGLRLSAQDDGGQAIQAVVTRRANRNLRSATDLRFVSYGSVVGVLGRVTAYKERRAALWSDIDGSRVEIRYREAHQEDLRNAWAHVHVEVTGLLHENAAGQILRVDLDSLSILDTDRPSLSEALPSGFYPELTQGMTADDYLRAIRGEE